jgi:hypothetical protein
MMPRKNPTVGAGTVAAGMPASGTRSHGPATAVGLGAEPRMRRTNTMGVPTRMLDQVMRLHLHLRRILRPRPVLRPEEALSSTWSLHPMMQEAPTTMINFLVAQEAPPTLMLRPVAQEAPSVVPSGAAGGGLVPGSRARPQPSAAPNPARGRQATPNADRSSQPYRSGSRTLAEALAAAHAMTRYPPPLGTLEYEAWREELHAYFEFAKLHQDSVRARSQSQ